MVSPAIALLAAFLMAAVSSSNFSHLLLEQGSTQGDRLPREWDVTPEILTPNWLGEEVRKENGRCWQESGIESVNLVPS